MRLSKKKNSLKSQKNLKNKDLKSQKKLKNKDLKSQKNLKNNLKKNFSKRNSRKPIFGGSKPGIEIDKCTPATESEIDKLKSSLPIHNLKSRLPTDNSKERFYLIKNPKKKTGDEGPYELILISLNSINDEEEKINYELPPPKSPAFQLGFNDFIFIDITLDPTTLDPKLFDQIQKYVKENWDPPQQKSIICSANEETAKNIIMMTKSNLNLSPTFRRFTGFTLQQQSSA